MSTTTDHDDGLELVTAEIATRLRAQYPQGASLDQLVIAKFFTPWSNWTWYAMNQDPEDPDYLWGIVEGFGVEEGSFSLEELKSVTGPAGLKIERDVNWTPIPARQVLHTLTGS